jgi:hypothetical protein
MTNRKTEFIYIPSGLATPELEIMLAKVQSLINLQKKVVIATCSGGKNYACSFNIYGLKSICHVCKSQTLKGLENLQGNYEHISTPLEIDNRIKRKFDSFEIRNRNSIKNYKFINLDIGQAAYSSYIASTRDQDLEGLLAHFSIKKLLACSEQLAIWFYKLLAKQYINSLTIYNGRQNQYRPIFRIAVLKKIQVEVMEFSGQDSKCVYIFKNSLPQDLEYLFFRINHFCKSLSNKDLDASALFYYTFKKNGGVINDRRSYVLNQHKNLLPDNWKKENHNIVIFNSSEDEFLALGGQYDKTLYFNQFKAIEKICKSLVSYPEIRIWLRIHPNLKSVRWTFSKGLFSLSQQFKNLHIIKGDSPVSSYKLLSACNAVVTFGSTMGIEATYWGKPSILLGRCVYEKFNTVYVPKSHSEVIQLLKDKNLKAKPKLGAMKVAAFWTKGGNSLKYFEGDKKQGFTFNNTYISKSYFNTAIYFLSKFTEHILLNDIINFRMHLLGIKFFGMKK